MGVYDLEVSEGFSFSGSPVGYPVDMSAGVSDICVSADSELAVLEPADGLSSERGMLFESDLGRRGVFVRVDYGLWLRFKEACGFRGLLLSEGIEGLLRVWLDDFRLPGGGVVSVSGSGSGSASGDKKVLNYG